VFSVVNAVLARPLPYPHAERVVWLAERIPRMHFEAVAQPDFVDWQREARSFDKIFAYGYQDSPVMVNGQSELAGTVTVSEDYWAVSGARPFLGRLPARGDSGVAVLSYDFYQRHFGNNPQVAGKVISLNQGTATVSGVLPPGFRFLPPLDFPTIEPREVDLYIAREPAAMHQSRSGGVSINLVAGRLRPGVTAAEARGELEGIQGRIAKAFPGWAIPETKVVVMPLQEKLVAKSRQALMVLLAAVVLLLLIACVNIANLLLARASTRQKEFSIRAAMGAGRRRMAWQFVAEGIVLGGAGGAAGLLLAHWGVAALLRVSRNAVPRLAETTIDGRVLAFTAALSLATGFVFALVPAFSFTRSNLHQVLKEGSRGASDGGSRLRVRRLLVTAELAIAVVLLVGAGLLLKGYWLMTAHAPGFDPQRIVLLKLNFSGAAYNARPAQEAYLKQVLGRVRGTPGVEAAGLTCSNIRGIVNVIGAPPYPPNQAPQTVYISSSPGFFQAVGARLVRGRWLADDEASPAVMINETFARQVFGTADPVGRQIGIPPVNPAPGKSTAATIAGVVADQKYTKLDVEPGLVVYMPYQQYGYLRRMDVVAKIAGTAPPLDRVAAGVDPTQTVYDMKTLEQAMAESVAPRRFNLLLLVLFASVALVLALVGIYGVMSYAVSQRTHEIGIRMALGAQRREVVRMVVRQGMLVALAGIAAGVAAALGTTRLMASLLYEVTPTDAATFCAVCGILAVAALAACWVPALWAARVDPTVALHYE
jgi:putative ABC transport system permease protein